MVKLWRRGGSDQCTWISRISGLSLKESQSLLLLYEIVPWKQGKKRKKRQNNFRHFDTFWSVWLGRPIPIFHSGNAFTDDTEIIKASAEIHPFHLNFPDVFRNSCWTSSMEVFHVVQNPSIRILMEMNVSARKSPRMVNWGVMPSIKACANSHKFKFRSTHRQLGWPQTPAESAYLPNPMVSLFRLAVDEIQNYSQIMHLVHFNEVYSNLKP